VSWNLKSRESLFTIRSLTIGDYLSEAAGVQDLNLRFHDFRLEAGIAFTADRARAVWVFVNDQVCKMMRLPGCLGFRMFSSPRIGVSDGGSLARDLAGYVQNLRRFASGPPFLE
jgi:hypothetical protein